MAKRITLIHAVQTAIAPTLHAFREGWPEAVLANLLDDDLMPAYTRAGGAVMLLDNKSIVRNHHDKELMSILAPETR